MPQKNQFSHVLNVFHGNFLPEDVQLAGYSAIIETYQLKVPLPDILAAIGSKHRIHEESNWLIMTPRHVPEDSLYGHLSFALKYEGINLAVLKALFDEIDSVEIINIINLYPTGAYSRRIWFLFEWLQDAKLKLPDAKFGRLIDALDEELQFGGQSIISKRHRIRNNLPGVPAFCPIVRKTALLNELINLNLKTKAKEMIGSFPQNILMRAAAFMLLKDSKASFAIEGETPPQTRAERWGAAIAEAGNHALTDDEFLRLQELIVQDFRFIQPGYRNEGGFVGEHERGTGYPIPEHISAKYTDLFKLMDGLIATDELLKKNDIDPIIAAASIAFGFVFIHPFADGNGRVHRYLIHHVLAEKKFTGSNIIFPVSAVILNRIEEYQKVLEAFSKPRLSLIKWRPTVTGNVEVLNETINLYRYFDATKQAEFLYQCIKETIEQTLPEEIDYLQKHDELKQFIKNYINMPDNTIELLMRFLNQGKGILSQRARKKEFSLLTEDEVRTLENKYADVFNR